MGNCPSFRVKELTSGNKEENNGHQKSKNKVEVKSLKKVAFPLFSEADVKISFNSIFYWASDSNFNIKQDWFWTDF